VALIAIAAFQRPDDRAGPCGVRIATNLTEVPEASGLAVSRRHGGILWTHNDSGNAAILFAIDAATGAVRGRVRVPIQTGDWEDISAARCPAGDCLYIADIGDNRRGRGRIRIYRVPEPSLDAVDTAPPEVFHAIYPAGARDAEGLFIVGGDIFVVTKDRIGEIYRATLPQKSGVDLKLARAGQFGLGPVTDAETSPDEASIVVRTHRVVAIHRTADVLRGGTIAGGVRISVEGLGEPQGEGVAPGRDGMLYLASEGRPWNRGGRFTALQCSFPR
jgi:hypothetical protein